MKNIFIFFLILLISNSVFSQSPEWRNYSSNQRIVDIANDGDNMWIAGNGGLFLLNKKTVEVTNYNNANSGIPDNNIYSLKVASPGVVWFGTMSSGIGKFDGNKVTIYNTKNSGLPHNQHNRVMNIDSQGNLWVGSLAYLSKFNGKKWYNYITGDSISSNLAIFAIEFDQTGTTWVGASWGLGYFNGEGVVECPQVTRTVYSLAIDKQDNIWAGTGGSGLITFNQNTNTWSKRDTSNSPIPGNIIYDLKFDSRERLWLATNKGLACFDGVNWTIYNTENSDLPQNFIMDLEIDENDVLWLGLLDAGLMRFDGAAWRRYDLGQSPLPAGSVFAIEVDNEQNVWLGGYSGLIKYDGTKWHKFGAEPGSPQSSLNCLEADSAGSLWFGATGANPLGRYDGTNFFVYDSTTAPFSREQVNVIYTGKQGNIWIGSSYSGLYKFDGNDWICFNTDNSPLPSNMVYCLKEDPLGNLWIGTFCYGFYADDGSIVFWEGGLVKKHGDEWTVYNKDNSGLPFNSISDMEFAADGAMWIAARDDEDVVGGFYGGGLTRYDGQNWYSYNMDNSPLPGNTIFDMCIDKNDNLWLATFDSGLVKFDGAEQWTIYNTTNSGIASNAVACVAIDSAGHKWIGHLYAGLSVFREGGVLVTEPVNGNITAEGFQLLQNFPNPFNNATTIAFSLDKASRVNITIYNILGQQVAKLCDANYTPGVYTLQWYGKSSTGAALPGGVYFYSLKTNVRHLTKKMLLLR